MASSKRTSCTTLAQLFGLQIALRLGGNPLRVRVASATSDLPLTLLFAVLNGILPFRCRFIRQS